MNVANEVKQLTTTWADIGERNETVMERGRRRMDMKSKLREFEVGDKVWRIVVQPGSLKPKYNGPYNILRRIGNVNYKIGGIEGLPDTVVHVDQLMVARINNRRPVKLYPRPRGRPGGEKEIV
jgi:hypothetical protein